MGPYLAVDIGASSGRLILGEIAGGALHTEEVRRFPNGAARKDGALCWDVDRLYGEVLAGLKSCAASGRAPRSVGVDTWGVDFVLLDRDGRRLGPAVSYRDGRTEGMEEAVYRLIPASELYARTGIQRQSFNTIFQLMALRRQQPGLLDQAHAMLLIPDYLHYRLTGVMAGEYTNATTTGLVNAQTRDWDWEVIGRLGFPRRLFQPLKQPGSVLGPFTEETAAAAGYSAVVTLPATHDTGSAVAAVPAPEGGALYLSSGTWSLLGTELPGACCDPAGEAANFTNEGGCCGTVRYLKNIMGLWMVQSLRRELFADRSFAELSALARESGAPCARVDVNDGCFLAPASMAEAVEAYCRRTGQGIPTSPGELLAVVYHSLAECYADAVGRLGALTGRRFSSLHIVGGGARDDYLNALTARCAGIPVHAGPVEATAVGNLAVQMLGQGAFSSLAEVRKTIAGSFPIRTFQP